MVWGRKKMSQKDGILKKISKKYINFVDESNERLERSSRRQQSWESRAKGARGELIYKIKAKYWEGKDVHRTGIGSDFTEQERDLLTGEKIEPKYYVEVKNGPNAKLSKLQELEQNKRRHYKVIHYGKKKK